ncbi:alpha-glucuronidase [Sphingobacterium sp. lm-10]|uniref:alpha-glucuronidase n=1 Tax=Sphingobacterium sp. lm-10 TaxID=2944904 RepID=UPI0020215955|nr:alpha-glucuronidase [Sphingobacterium sp. lm-10]MCL7986685.1 alpha-glucuronidase [Sphingobacterium sp. lm-10]
MNKPYFLTLLIVLLPLVTLFAEDGSQLWLRYQRVAPAVSQQRTIVTKSTDETAKLAVQELADYWVGQDVELKLDAQQKQLKDGFHIQGDSKRITVIAQQPIGLLYGAYRLLQWQQTGKNTADKIELTEIPSFDIRMLNHWDNLDRTVERGYAGHSLWLWDELPHQLSPRYEQYARANASVGINAVVLNNVNASPQILTPSYIHKVKALADLFRRYGIKVYLSANFSSPIVLGGLPDSDPLRPEVQGWWAAKVTEIYAQIPDFGGFLIKANSEGQPGPQDYGRSHAEGANMLADAVKPFGGMIMWRAFVYNPTSEDRAKQAYTEFEPLDGQFRDNVIVQIKNGAIDFQPREPFHPLFGAMKQSNQMVEFQITQEYLGFSNHLVYLAPLFKETLDADTYAHGPVSTVAKMTDGTFRPGFKTAIAGVANIGEDANWTGHHFAQANWYAYGRLAWNHQLSSEDIAEEWIRLSFTNEEAFVAPVKDLMLASRETAVNYMMPLGLHHIFAFDHHYGPEPWGDVAGGRPDWMPWYYHNADVNGVGFDRTASGSNAVAQYHEPVQQQYSDPKTCPETLLLWFHHLPWLHKTQNGNTLWDELCFRYDGGVQEAEAFENTWDQLEKYVDTERFAEVQAKLKIQAQDAVWWKDAVLLYFQTFSNLPIPSSVEKPVHQLEDLQKIKLDLKHHN